MSDSLQAVRGMNDALPREAQRWDFLEQTVRAWTASYGYQAIRTPILEHTGLFKRAIGEVTDIVEKEMYTFIDELNGESLTLRPEGTASCVRAAIQHNLLYDGPKRLWYMGPMFRHERPQKGRYRQFHQVGVEAFGYAEADCDAELILMGADLWRRLSAAVERHQVEWTWVRGHNNHEENELVDDAAKKAVDELLRSGRSRGVRE